MESCSVFSLWESMRTRSKTSTSYPAWVTDGGCLSTLASYKLSTPEASLSIFCLSSLNRFLVDQCYRFRLASSNSATWISYSSEYIPSTFKWFTAVRVYLFFGLALLPVFRTTLECLAIRLAQYHLLLCLLSNLRFTCTLRSKCSDPGTSDKGCLFFHHGAAIGVDAIAFLETMWYVASVLAGICQKAHAMTQ
jgi:hypothetical protein